MHAHIITIGDEILIGQIIDSNSAHIAEQLTQIGLPVRQITSVDDSREGIQSILSELKPEDKVVLMTGGLGPTNDDVTKKVLAAFLQTEMVFHEPTWERIQHIMNRLGRKATEAHRQQSFMPASAELLHNKMGTAPGMWFEEKGRIFISLPGVPYEMKYLMEREVLPRLQEALPLKALMHRTILTAGEGESRIAERLASLESTLPPHLSLAYLPNLGKVRLRLTARGDDPEFLEEELLRYSEKIQTMIPELIYGYEKMELAEAVGELLLEKQWRLVTAESCTGGHLAHQITSIPGSSRYFKGSIIAYSNEVKQQQLGVQAATLQKHGAVSEATVREMVQGALKTLQAEVAVAISGVAGPGGGSDAKPVGTVWIAVGHQDRIIARCFTFGKDRSLNIQWSSNAALNLLRKFLLD